MFDTLSEPGLQVDLQRRSLLSHAVQSKHPAGRKVRFSSINIIISHQLLIITFGQFHFYVKWKLLEDKTWITKVEENQTQIKVDSNAK